MTMELESPRAAPPSLDVEQVFRTSGVPTHTFVRPVEFDRLRIAVRTPGRGVVVEGPAGIGKTTAVTKALEESGTPQPVTRLNARKDMAHIATLADTAGFGTVVIDDFHRLPEDVRKSIADLITVLADADDDSRKIVIIGISRAGSPLIDCAPDLSNRIDVLRFDAQPAAKVAALVRQGCAALDIEITAHERIVAEAAGSFCLAQLLCLEACVRSGCLASSGGRVVIDASFESIRRQVLHNQATRFGTVLLNFTRGTAFRPNGRAPFLHILRWLIDSPDLSISLRAELRRHPSEKASVGVVLDEGRLRRLARQGDVADLLHFDPLCETLTVEDPVFAFYLRNLDWPPFVAEVGFTRVDYDHTYDVALSFAGEDREFAEFLAVELRDIGHAVFYDRTEQHEILATNVEDYLRPIYESGSRYVVVLLGPQYGVKRWTLFEASSYGSRIDAGQVIPVRTNGMSTAPFDRMRDIGCLVFNPKFGLWPQAKEIAAMISRRLST